MISPGDIDPPENVYNDLQNYIRNNYLWYPFAVNHEAETIDDINWFHAKTAKSAKGFLYLSGLSIILLILYLMEDDSILFLLFHSSWRT